MQISMEFRGKFFFYMEFWRKGSLTGSVEARECTLGLYILCQIRLCDIWPVRANKTANWPSVGTKSLVVHVWKLHMLSLQLQDIWRPHISNFFETSCGLACMLCDFPRVHTGFGPYGAVDCPRASCDLCINYLMLRSHAWNPRMFPSP